MNRRNFLKRAVVATAGAAAAIVGVKAAKSARPDFLPESAVVYLPNPSISYAQYDYVYNQEGYSVYTATTYNRRYAVSEGADFPMPTPTYPELNPYGSRCAGCGYVPSQADLRTGHSCFYSAIEGGTFF